MHSKKKKKDTSPLTTPLIANKTKSTQEKRPIFNKKDIAMKELRADVF